MYTHHGVEADSQRVIVCHSDDLSARDLGSSTYRL
jgi:hypothetical protein